jgi:CCR4-NOT transcription complex subunit 6
MSSDDYTPAPDTNLNINNPSAPTNDPCDSSNCPGPPGTPSPSRKDGNITSTLSPPPERAWISLTSQPDGRCSDANAETFTVLCYNILCENYATDKNFPHSPAPVLAWEYRKKLILEELVGRDADILCLQEVDVAQYQDYFLPNLKDYEGLYSEYKTASTEDRKYVDGCAIFYKKSRFVLL